MDDVLNEKDLLLRIAAGDEIAFGMLFHRLRDKLYFFILRITGSAETAEDVLQDVFVKLWMNRSDIVRIDNFDAYIFRMCHNKAISGIRRMARETLILADLKKDAANASLTPTLHDDVLIQKEFLSRLQTILRKLPVQQRLVYTMTREQGLKQEEIAHRLKISASTVKNHMTRALQTIHRELGRYYQSSSSCLLLVWSFFRKH